MNYRFLLRFHFILYCFFILGFLWAYGDVKIDISFNPPFYEGLPIKGSIIVSHNSKSKIDSNRFEINGSPLHVNFEKEEPMTASGDLILSFFNFSLPAQPKGPHILPQISVIVDEKKYFSTPITYQVKEINAQGTTVTEPTASGQVEIFLRLEAFINGPKELYPGQQTTVGYRYIFNTNIEMTHEFTPLLDAVGFLKIGEKVIKEAESEGIYIQQIEQTIEAKEPGNFNFGPSHVEGRPYTETTSGQKGYAKQLISSAAPVITLQVKRFPEKGKPLSFNGAVGDFSWKVSLASSPKVYVGDEIELLVQVDGKGNFDSINLPELCCQPGISGLFGLSGLPAVGKMVDSAKYFNIKLKPLSTRVKAIPSLEFSSFNPDTGVYNIFHSEPIALDVVALVISPVKTEEGSSPPPSEEKQESTTSSTTAEATNGLEAIEVQKLYPLTPPDLKNLLFGTWWSLLWIPFGIAAMIFQINLSKYLLELKRMPRQENRETFFHRALAAPAGSSEQEILLGKALLQSLFEKGFISKATMDPKDLSMNGITGEVRSFLIEMEEKRYTGQPLNQKNEITQRAQKLYEEIDRST